MSQVKDIAVKCFRDEAQAILDLIPQLDEHFDAAVDLMLRCTGKVIITGVGKSGHIGAKMAATLASTGTPAFFINPLDVFHGDLMMSSLPFPTPARPMNSFVSYLIYWNIIFL